MSLSEEIPMSFSPLEVLLSRTLCPGLLSEEALSLVCRLVVNARLGEISLDVSSEKETAETLARNFPSTLILENSRLYLQKHYAYEKTIFSHLKRLNQETINPVPPPDTTHLNLEQQEAVRKALCSPVTFITGGPGTGKTHTAAAIISAILGEANAYVILTAPTGKAAAHLAKKLPHPNIRSGTLHSFLKGEDPVLVADLIIVDESSMLDAALFSKLLSSIPDKTRVVFLGDKNQLPPVESGRIFKECIETLDPQWITTLSHCHRTDNLEILRLAEAILNGTLGEIPLSPLTVEAIENTKTFFPEVSPSPPTEEELFSYAGRFTLLSCIRKGPFGADAINNRLFAQLSFQRGWLAVPILITKNDDTVNLYNGDTGFLILENGTPKSAFFPHFGRSFSPFSLPSYEYGYCLSVHKSQGSEYDKVFVLIPDGAERFGKEILYTAVTRAKKEVTLLGNAQTLKELYS